MRMYTADAQALTMQQAALRRVREMQQRSRAVVAPQPYMPQARDQPSPPPAQESRPQPEAQRDEPQPFRQQPVIAVQPKREPPGLHSLLEPFLRRDSGGRGETLSSLGEGIKNALGSAVGPAQQLLDSFGIGGEELIILMVMYAVFRERGDKTLLLALGYLLL